MVQMMKNNWWMLVVRGLFAVLFGIVVLMSPGIALTVLVLLWGAYALVDGIGAVAAGIRGRQDNKNWWVAVLEGVIGIGAGVLTFIWPGITAIALLYVVAFWAVITGVLEIIAAVQLRKEITGEFWLGLSGVLSVLFGIFLIMSPGAGILSLLWLVSIYAIAFGVMMIILGFRVRNMPDSDSQPSAPQAA